MASSSPAYSHSKASSLCKWAGIAAASLGLISARPQTASAPAVKAAIFSATQSGGTIASASVVMMTPLGPPNFCCKVWRRLGDVCEKVDDVSGGRLEQSGDELCLGPDVVAADVPNLPFPDHCHRLVACQRSSGRPKPPKPSPGPVNRFTRR